MIWARVLYTFYHQWCCSYLLFSGYIDNVCHFKPFSHLGLLYFLWPLSLSFLEKGCFFSCVWFLVTTYYCCVVGNNNVCRTVILLFETVGYYTCLCMYACMRKIIFFLGSTRFEALMGLAFI